MSYKVVLPQFLLDNLKRLKKKNPHVNADVKIALQALVENPSLGVVIPGALGARKLRVRNSDLQRGKSGGYRLIYFVDGHREVIYPLLLYAKSEQDNVTMSELHQLLKDLQNELRES